MGELLGAFNKYWAVAWSALSSIVIIAFTLGRLWVRVENAIRSTDRFHNKANELTAQSIENTTNLVNLEKRVDKFEDMLTANQKEAGEQYGNLVGRIDNIFQLISSRKDT